MKKTRQKNAAVEKAAKAVVKSGRPKKGAEKKVVTLYLESELYEKLKAIHSGEVSRVINDLVREYLKQNAS